MSLRRFSAARNSKSHVCPSSNTSLIAEVAASASAGMVETYSAPCPGSIVLCTKFDGVCATLRGDHLHAPIRRAVLDARALHFTPPSDHC